MRNIGLDPDPGHEAILDLVHEVIRTVAQVDRGREVDPARVQDLATGPEHGLDQDGEHDHPLELRISLSGEGRLLFWKSAELQGKLKRNECFIIHVIT